MVSGSAVVEPQATAKTMAKTSGKITKILDVRNQGRSIVIPPHWGGRL
jgi:hypothetical protein